ncbi:MAG: hypothetical protein H6641_24705 [Caldilineaceae bacterium]|nr:hypothetical protein [Caldilineaceae bacterium]
MKIEVYCEIESICLEQLKTWFSELTPLHCSTGQEYLAAIFIVSSQHVEETINTILGAGDDRRGRYKAGPYISGAFAIPVKLEGNLACYVVLTRDKVEMFQFQELQYDAVSTLLEELLHVEQYALTWQKFKRLIPEPAFLSQEQFLNLASFIIDEYWVARQKAPIIAQNFSVVAPDGASTPLYLWYGGNLIELLNEAQTRIHIFRASKSLKNSDLEEIGSTIVRYIFETLARDAAFRTANPKHTQPENLILLENDSPFYNGHVAEYWKSIHKQMVDFYEDQITKESAVREIASSLQNFVNYILY